MAKEAIIEEKNPFEGLDFVALSTAVNKEKEKESNKDAMKLIRIKITCNNPNKRNYEGEIFTIANAQMEVKKFVPFNVPYHVPLIMFNAIKEKKCTIFTKKRGTAGIRTSESKLINEYNVEVLPPISDRELEAIKNKQLVEEAQLQD